MLGLHPSHILFCLLLAALTGQKETSENTELCHSPHTTVHIQAIPVNGVLISQTDVSRG